MKKLLAVLMIFSVYAMAGENASLPLPTTGNVTLTLAEYNRLVELAAKSAKKRETPPLPYALKRADLKLHVANDAVLGTVQMDGEVFSKGATKVPLTTGLTILNARQEGKALPLEQEGSASTAILPGASEFSVALDTGLPLVIEAGRASFNLPVPAAGSVRLSLVIPGDHSIVRISPGLITSRTTEKGQTTLEATLVPGQPATVWWITGIVQVPVIKHEVRFLSDVKTLVTVNDEELRIAALADINVIQGDPTQFAVELPTGYEITGVSGPTVESSEIENGKLIVRLNSSAPRNHEFLISMERPLSGTKTDAPFLSFKDTQRETGEVLVEGTGAMELTATEGGGLKRMDLKEVNPYLRSLARFPLQAAFRYHRQPTEIPTLALEWTRFPDSTVLAAVAEHAVVTTLVTVEGRTLTEVKLTVKNQAQPFLKVNLPAGATIVSADVAGEKVKPVQGPDGNRVPLLRAGFRPSGPYEVSFVFMHSGTPFAKKGGSELALPSMDVPISLLEWELFLPEQYKVKDFGGDAIAAYLLPAPMVENGDVVTSTFSGVTLHSFTGVKENAGLDNLALFTPGINGGALQPGQMEGYVTDPQGAVVSGAQIRIINVDNGRLIRATTDSSGHWTVMRMPPGQYRVEASANGFRTSTLTTRYDTGVTGRYDFKLSVGETSTTVEVTASAPIIETTQSQVTTTFRGSNVSTNGSSSGSGGKKDHDRKKQEPANYTYNNASANVLDLQKRVAGVLPVRIDVPRAGNSYRFVRALVLDEETKVTFNYKTSAKR
ncbi:MAG TPA: carboxypeptidase-like regulatory domain-containing protein [Candidatus Angelobacter sp.]|nr:carboxypeptidase-like regulatory domain-containing protein [Candidatus Angelobacter sp.]